MNDDYMKQQGTVIPTMFIGLGGIGSRIVDRVADRASRLPNWEAQLRELTTFVAIDTNKLDLDDLKSVPSGSRIHIGAVDKQQIVDNYRKSNNRQALQWIDRNYRPRPGEKPGAGQIRVESRLGYHYASPGIRTKLEIWFATRWTRTIPGAPRQRATTSICSAVWRAARAREPICQRPT